ncbi:MAG: hypothetical protein ACPGYV_02660 [Phycisphaeraceae bacterium]
MSAAGHRARCGAFASAAGRGGCGLGLLGAAAARASAALLLDFGLLFGGAAALGLLAALAFAGGLFLHRSLALSALALLRGPALLLCLLFDALARTTQRLGLRLLLRAAARLLTSTLASELDPLGHGHLGRVARVRTHLGHRPLLLGQLCATLLLHLVPILRLQRSRLRLLALLLIVADHGGQAAHDPCDDDDDGDDRAESAHAGAPLFRLSHRRR